WGIGFIRKLEIMTGAEQLAKLAPVLEHPSCRLLEALQINRAFRPTPVAISRDLLPRSLRRLEVFGGIAEGSDLSALPYLEHLQLEEPSSETLATIPRVARLELRRDSFGRVFERLEHCLPHVRELVLQSVPLELADVGVLARLLDGRKLARLALERCGLTKEDRPLLETLCDELEFDAPNPSAGAVTIEHANKPEWGRGTLVREYDGKIDVEFPSAGKKTFKADAPFLRRSR
ncbi:MAG: DUF3553 domain-containing protein, partial [Deltaproteobacteria bacterium]|nr:DUF3553 domain-containing protein [Deltaproteobacteria bacterium]